MTGGRGAVSLRGAPRVHPLPSSPNGADPAALRPTAPFFFPPGPCFPPVVRPFGLGAEVLFAARNSYYRDFPDVHRRNPQFRLFTTLMP